MLGQKARSLRDFNNKCVAPVLSESLSGKMLIWVSQKVLDVVLQLQDSPPELPCLEQPPTKTLSTNPSIVTARWLFESLLLGKPTILLCAPVPTGCPWFSASRSLKVIVSNSPEGKRKRFFNLLSLAFSVPALAAPSIPHVLPLAMVIVARSASCARVALRAFAPGTAEALILWPSGAGEQARAVILARCAPESTAACQSGACRTKPTPSLLVGIAA